MQAKFCDESVPKLYDRRKNSLKPKNNLVNIDWVVTTYDHFETVSLSHT